MTYILEKITPADIEIIRTLGNARQRQRMSPRFRFFEDNDPMVRAINKESGYFLMMAPKEEIFTATQYYFYFFKERLFDITVENFGLKPIQLLDAPSPNDMAEFREELASAFSIHNIFGTSQDKPDFVLKFSESGV